MERGEYVKCVVCGDERLIKRLKSFGGALVKCTECGLVFRNPRPTYETIREYYKESYSNIFYEEKIKTHRKKIFLHFLANAIKSKEGGRLLDVGCGYGEFLKLAKDKGWEVYGVELSNDACQYVQNKPGLNIFCGELKEASFPKDHFDVVTLWNVLDHTINPLEELLEIKKILKPGGFLFIRVPNFLFQEKAFLFSKIIGKLHFFSSLNLARKLSVAHLYCFTPSSIRKILKVVGFSAFPIHNARLSKGDPYGVFPLLGDEYIGWLKNGFLFICEVLYYLSMRKILWGSSIEVFVCKLD